MKNTLNIKQNKREMKEQFNNVKDITGNPFIKLKLVELFNNYKYISQTDVHFCCYGKEQPCWFDIEGEDYGWLWHNYYTEETDYLDREGVRKALLKQAENSVDFYKSAVFLISENRKRAEIRIVEESENSGELVYIHFSNVEGGY